jgi:chromosome segregation ATPase
MIADELERRVRTLEEELNGERHVSRYSVEQATRNSDVLHAVRSEVSAVTARVDNLGGDMAAVKAALAMHGRALDVLMQDVRELRRGQDELRRGQEDLRRGQDELRARLDTDLAELRARLDTNLAELRVRLDTDLAEVSRKLDLLIAAVVPRDPA